MKFSSKAEMLAAMAIVGRWLPDFILRFQKGVRDMGLRIMKQVMENYPDGTVDPVLHLRSLGKWTLQLRLGNSLEEFLTIDRDEEPVRVDARLFDEAFADRKLASIVEGRLALVRALVESRDPAEFKRKMEKLAPRFEHVRLWEYEGGEKRRDKRCDGS